MIPSQITPGILKRRRRKLRKEQTKAEYVLWQELRSSKRKYKFKRQVSIGIYIVDFFCQGLRLVIELDGPIHDEKDQKIYDTKRQLYLEQQGNTVIRFSNDEVLFKREIVLTKIDEICKHLSLRR